ncbi:PREDICTED: nuclear pore complex protein Nup88 isoform X2 [Polistes dominula]|uniref:Nuclear pore complex protein Nup88 isoform X2 n=1 Tax=Polistes dominula TaxID=743375 RepID=A0ABM1IAE4_POLDO|nr:PREDICTED: nuclear pore complex protein Nup88 isoform X2 [Polistes dominula]
MSSCTDPLHLNEIQLFKELKRNLSGSTDETRNILEIRDDILYVWNADKCCLQTLNVGATRGKFDEDIPYQTLQPTDPPIFEVLNISINETATQVAIWGNLGIAVIELPKRWGKDAAFQGGKEIILCASHCFGDFSATTEIRKARWHPGSTNDSHLLVLTSENIFRLYECEINGTPKLVKSWKVGRTPMTSTRSKVPNFASLGDTAVDFDFATPTLRKPELFAGQDINEAKNSVDWNQIEWPILVLRGNGEVLIVRENVLYDNSDKPVVYGSLSMYPETDDNYGIDSCSIMCIQTTPPIVVIAMCNGKIYHAILLKETPDENVDDKKTWSQYGSSYSLHTPDDALYIFECIEMELGLFFTDDDKKYNCPIYVHNDKGNKSRYFCSHNAGIHMVSLPMVSQLDNYINNMNEKIEDSFLPSLSNESSSHYLICTRTKHTEIDEPTPILGFGLIQEPCVLIALLHTGDVVDLSVIDPHYLPRVELSEPVVTSAQKVNKESFDMYIKNLFKNDTSQPITKLGKQSMTLKECVELLFHVTQIFRRQHFVRQDKAREEINKKIRALKALKTHLLKETDTLMETKKELQQTAERLAERYEDIKDKQEELARRAEEVLRLVNYKEPSMSPSERAEAEELKRMNDKIQDLRVRLKQLKKKANQQSVLMENTEIIEKQKEIIFSKNQVEAIRENLSKMTKDIKNMVVQVKNLEEEVGM